MKYNWKALSVVKGNRPDLGLKNVILEINWIKTGTNENGTSVDFLGATAVPPPDASKPFDSFDDLTEEQLINWITDSIDADQHAHIDSMISDMIATKENAVEVVEWTKHSTAVEEVKSTAKKSKKK